MFVFATLTTSIQHATTLSIDTNGDGTPDTLYFSDEYQEEIIFNHLTDLLNLLDTNTKTALLNRAENAHKQTERGNTRPAANLLTSLKQHIEHFSKTTAPRQNRIPEETALYLIAIIDVLLERLEE